MTYDYIMFDELRKRAEDNDPEALYILGSKYLNGNNLPMDSELAISYLSTSAALGFAKAQVAMGDIYKIGKTVNQEPELAVEYYKMAADQGYPSGIWNLSKCFEEGYGVEPNKALRMTLLKSAAKSGYVPAIYDLGLICLEEDDYSHARKYLHKAATLGHDGAQFELGLMFYNGNGVKKSYKKALKWFKLAASLGHAPALKMMGDMLRYGKGIDKDIHGAIEAYEGAIERMHYEAANDILDIYLMEPEHTDVNLAKVWAHRIINEGYEQAMLKVAYLYSGSSLFEKNFDMMMSVLEEGAMFNNLECKVHLAGYLMDYGSETDVDRATNLYMEAAEAGNAEAQYELYSILADSNPDDAAYWLRRSASTGAAYAMMDLAIAYETGDLVLQSNNMAIKWYSKAYKAGLKEAGKDISRLLAETNPFEESDFSDIDMKKKLALEDGEIDFFESIGDYYIDEKNEDYDMEQGIKWYTRGANLGIGACQNKLGFILYYGLAGCPDPQAAVGYLKGAAYRGFPYSQYLLGMCYLKGKGIEKNVDKARKWFERAAFLGNEKAQRNLAEAFQTPDTFNIKDWEALFV